MPEDPAVLLLMKTVLDPFGPSFAPSRSNPSTHCQFDVGDAVDGAENQKPLCHLPAWIPWASPCTPFSTLHDLHGKKVV